MAARNEFLAYGSSDASDVDTGYDSEAAEVSKTSRVRDLGSRSSKRRKLSHSASDSEDDIGASFLTAKDVQSPIKRQQIVETATKSDRTNDLDAHQEESGSEAKSAAQAVAQDTRSQRKSSRRKEQTPGVVYLSSLPPYLKPSALRNLLIQRGFGPIRRLFLTPASKNAAGAKKKSSRQLYSEGWIEFVSKKTARRCADALNAQPVGGKKGGFYHDDLWNMKYLKGISWEELMAGIREEKREEEGRRDEERRQLAAETKAFMEGVEEGRKLQGMQKKRSAKHKTDHDDTAGGDRGEQEAKMNSKRTWRQYEVAGTKKPAGKNQKHAVGQEVQSVLSKIF